MGKYSTKVLVTKTRNYFQILQRLECLIFYAPSSPTIRWLSRERVCILVVCDRSGHILDLFTGTGSMLLATILENQISDSAATDMRHTIGCQYPFSLSDFHQLF